MRPRWALLAGTGFVALYASVTLPGTPVLRALLMALFFGIAALRGRQVDAVQLLSLAAIVMLVLFPLDVMRPGFQLSFGTVLALCVFTQPLINRMTGQDDPAVWLERRLQAKHWLMAAGQWLDSRMLQILAAAVVAWIASMPLVARHFEQLNPYAVFFSILMAPLVFVALVCGLMKVVLTLVAPMLATLWADALIWPTVWMRRTVELLASFPGGDVPLPAPPWWLVAAFYASFGLLLIKWLHPGARWWMRLTPVATSLSLLVLPFNGGFTRPPSGGELRVTVLAVGAGQCVVVEPPNGRVMLIDAGSTSLTDLLRRCLGPYLRHRGCTSIDRVLISHPNLDHFSAVAEIAAAYGVREVLVSHQFHAAAMGNPPAEMMLKALERIDLSPRRIAPGEVIPLGRDTSLEVLWPARGARQPNSNDDSLVVRLTHAGRSILIPGDIQDPGKLGLMSAGTASLRSDVLIAPHHGAAEGSTPAFLRAVAPGFIISSNARRLTMKQRNFDALAGSAVLLRTHRYGAVTIRVSHDGKLFIEPFITPRD
jgi:competence protein ComEC